MFLESEQWSVYLSHLLRQIDRALPPYRKAEKEAMRAQYAKESVLAGVRFLQ